MRLLTLGKQTKPLLQQYGKIVPFLDINRPFSHYFRKSARFLKTYGKQHPLFSLLNLNFLYTKIYETLIYYQLKLGVIVKLVALGS